MPKWTVEQQKAIDERGRNLLVAAAAGSGKTAVLVERVKKLILEGDGCPIDRMLIVTFTEAAASEMKEKIERAIDNAILEKSERGEDSAYLRQQLDLLPHANISTFHSFALEIIRRYFYLIQLEPNFRIMDGDQQEILKTEVMEEMVESLYEENEKEFYTFLKKYSGERNDNKFKSLIFETYRTIMSYDDPFGWLEKAVKDSGMDLESFKNSDTINYIWEESEKSLYEALLFNDEMTEWAEEHNYPGTADLILSDRQSILGLIEDTKKREFNIFREKLVSGKPFINISKKYFDPKLNPEADMSPQTAQEEFANIRDLEKEKVNSLKELFFYDTIEAHHQLVLNTHESLEYLMKIVKRFHEEFSEKKREKGLMDFSDIEHFALEILEHEEASNYYKSRFEHVFVDEYQDSSYIQEALIARVARDNNCFMVGDVKQSIYRFRLAEPEIFQRRYRSYAEDEGRLSEKIDLNKNFRSKRPIIDFVNDVFRLTMDEYDENAELKAGDPHADECSFTPKIYLLDSESGDSLQSYSEGSDMAEDEGESVSDRIMQIRKEEREALACVKIIQDYLGKPFFDSKANDGKGEWRPLKRKDIVILMRAVKGSGEAFYEVLSDNGIPCFIDDNDGYFDTIEINTFMALLQILDNARQDIPLLSIMRSAIFDFSVIELAEIRISYKNCEYSDAARLYAAKGPAPEHADDNGLGLETGVDSKALMKKLSKMFEKLNEWRELSRTLPLEELVWEILLDSGFYIAMGAYPAGTQRQANLRALVDKAMNYRKNQGGSLYGFMNYIERVKKGNVSTGQVKLVGEDDDSVRIMTIHKSKGLEFPMVIQAGFAKQKKYGQKTDIFIHKDLGIGLKYVNYEKKWFAKTLTQRAIARKTHPEEVAEEERILYVSMTRARDCLVMLSAVKKMSETIDKIKTSPRSDNSYLQMVGRIILNKPGTLEIIDDGELGEAESFSSFSGKKAAELIDSANAAISDETRRKMEYSYPNIRELKIKSKYSVSELNSEKHISELAEPASFKIRTDFSAAQVGSFTHKLLEIMDVKDLVERGGEYVTELIEYSVKSEFLTAEEAKAVNSDALVKLGESEIGRRMAKAFNEGKLRREQSFNMMVEVDGVETIAQGIIDAYFTETSDDGREEIVLLDYKTSRSSNEEKLREEYSMQIELYKKALMEGSGLVIKEAYLYLTNHGMLINMM